MVAYRPTTKEDNRNGASEREQQAGGAPHPRNSEEQAEDAVRTLLRWAGEDPAREGLLDTPKRVVARIATGSPATRSIRPTTCGRTFEEVAGYDEMIVLRDIEFESLCEHHMAPIIGRAHVGYLPTDKVVGISKLARVVDGYARRFQVQEKLTAQIAHCIDVRAEAARRRRRHRRRASVHDHARRAQARRIDDHQPDARHVPRGCAYARGVPALHRRHPRALTCSLAPRSQVNSCIWAVPEFAARNIAGTR